MEFSILSGKPTSHALPSGRSLSGDQSGMDAFGTRNLLHGFAATMKPTSENPQGKDGEESKISKDKKTGVESENQHGLEEISLQLKLGSGTCITRKRKTSCENTSAKRMKLGCRNDASLELRLYLDPWAIKKRIQTSDIGHLSRLLLAANGVKQYILPLWDTRRTENIRNGVQVAVRDFDTKSGHELTFKKWPSGSYVLIGKWTSEFVRRRNLQKGDEIGLFWDQSNSRFIFSLLNPTPRS